MKNKNFYILTAVVAITFWGCNSSEYDVKKYLADTGFDSAKEWYDHWTGKMSQQDVDDMVTARERGELPEKMPEPFRYLYHDFDKVASGRIVLKSPAAIIMHPENGYEGYSFINLKNTKTATTLSQAKTLIEIIYSKASESYKYNFIVYDIQSKTIVAHDNKSRFIALIRGIIKEADNLLIGVRFADDGTDIFSVKEHNLAAVRQLGLDKVESPLYKTLHSSESTGKTAPDTVKLNGYRRTDVIAELKNDVLIFKSTYLPDSERDWLVIATAPYKTEYGNTLDEFEFITINGKNTKRYKGTKDVYKKYLNVFYISGKTGNIITEYSTIDHGMSRPIQNVNILIGDNLWVDKEPLNFLKDYGK